MSLWRHRDFRRLWGGETVSELGSQVSLLAIPLLAVRILHASPFEMGVLTAASTAAFLVVGLPTGVWVDRLSHRSVMIAADLGRLLAMGSIPVAYALGSLGLPQLYAVALAAGVFTVFFDVAYQSYLPTLVGFEAVTEGNAKLSTSAQVAQVAGPSVAGGLVQAFGSAVAVTADAVSFAFSAVAITAIRSRTPPLHVPEHRGMRREIAEGLRFVWGHRLLRAIAATTATSNFFGGIVAAIEIVFLVRVVHVEPAVIGLILACAGAGGVLGAVNAARIAAWIGGARATIVGIACTASMLLLPLSTTCVRTLALLHWLVHLRLRRRPLQRQPGELSPATLSTRPPWSHERDHALHRLGGPALRRPHRRGARTEGRPPADPLGGRRGRGVGHRMAPRLAPCRAARFPDRATHHTISGGGLAGMTGRRVT